MSPDFGVIKQHEWDPFLCYMVQAAQHSAHPSVCLTLFIITTNASLFDEFAGTHPQ